VIAEDRLRELLEDVALTFEPPADGMARIVEAADEDRPVRVHRPRFTPPRAIVAAAAAVVLVAIGLAWNDRGSGPITTADRSEAQSLQSGSANDASASSAQLSPAGPGGVAAGTATAPPGAAAPTTPSPNLAKVIKTGGLEVEVAKGRFGDAVSSITRLAVGAGGYVSYSKTTESSDHPSGTITVRVPADRFEAITTQLRGIGKVRSAETGGRDVTGEYTDVQARLRTLNATRASLLEVLSKARAIGDILAVQDRLNGVQTEIETLQGRQQVLDNQVGLATIAVSVHEPGGANLSAEPHRSAWHRAWSGFTGTWSSLLAHSGTALAVVLASAALVAILVAAFRWARRLYARSAA
jgi:hypothetical protein